ncbi:MAG TPA: class I SAM-dependent methyltransferase [Rhizomicrobium sp.]|jgi:hypothetical protein|nr:class I SAM-dependent methyltransferase [Rhizomicrobium sp.]
MQPLNLDELGIVAGTNKSSLWSDYLRHFDRTLAEFKDKPIDVLEIGVETGASLRMWRKFFRDATIVGLDLSPKCLQHMQERVTVEIGSQDDPGVLADLCSRHTFSVIIDDGSHRPEHVVFTFERLFPALLPGGVYIIEDLKGHFEQDGNFRKGPGSLSPIASLSKIGMQLMSGRIDSSDNFGIGKYLFESVDSVELISGAAIVRKRPKKLNVAKKLDAVEDLLQGADRPEAWGWLSSYLLKMGGPLEQAEKAARNAIALNSQLPVHYHQLSVVLERMGDRLGAIEQSTRAVALAEGTVAYKGYKAQLDHLNGINA